MKEFSDYNIERKTDKAVLVELLYDLEKPKKKIWFPLSKVEFNENVFKIDNDFFEEKMKLLIFEEEENNKLVIVLCKKFEELENSVKIIFEMNLKDRVINVWAWIPKKLISSIDVVNVDEEFINLTIPNWIWKKTLKSAIEKQLDFYNKESTIYNFDDFNLVTPVK